MTVGAAEKDEVCYEICKENYWERNKEDWYVFGGGFVENAVVEREDAEVGAAFV